ncbi:SGNH/GDSL hydrolase family protein [Flavitalea flava]
MKKMMHSGLRKKIGYGTYLILAVAVLLEILLRIYNPFHFRIKGDHLVLDTNKTIILKNNTIPVLDPEVVTYRNSLGFRGPERPDSFRNYISIITVGGSTTECNFLADGKTWNDLLLKRIRQDFDRVWLNNAGFAGHSTFGHLILMKDYISGIRPDMVLFLIGGNDMGREDLNSADRATSLNYYAGFFTFLSKKSELANVILNLVRARRAKMLQITDRYIDLAAHKNDTIVIPDSLIRTDISKNEHLLKGYSDRVEELIRISRSNGIQPVLMTQPSLIGKGTDSLTGANLELISVGNGYNGKLWWTLCEKYNNVTREVAKKENVLLIDLANEMPKTSLYFYDILHFTPEGAKKISALIYEGLRDSLANKYSGYLKK